MTPAAGPLRPGGFTRVMLLGEQAASKTVAWGSNPHARADCRRGSIQNGVRPAVFVFFSGIISMRNQSSALFVPMVSRIALDSPQRPGPGSIPGRDTDCTPCGCGGRMTAFEAVGRGSIPRRGILMRDRE